MAAKTVRSGSQMVSTTQYPIINLLLYKIFNMKHGRMIPAAQQTISRSLNGFYGHVSKLAIIILGWYPGEQV